MQLTQTPTGKTLPGCSWLWRWVLHLFLHFGSSHLNIWKTLSGFISSCFLWVCRHRWALGCGIYSETSANVLIVTFDVWNLERCLYNELHSKGIISIPMRWWFCVCLSAMQHTASTANKAQRSHLSKILIILQWGKIPHFNHFGILHIPLISFH